MKIVNLPAKLSLEEIIVLTITRFLFLSLIQQLLDFLLVISSSQYYFNSIFYTSNETMHSRQIR
jgi:hypothetical protein